jgi:glycine C-acetyltransferase
MKNAIKIWQQENDVIKNAGLWKTEGIITSAQSTSITNEADETLINMCANNYLGLSGDESVRAFAREALDTWGYGLSSVRFICGTQAVHTQLEKTLSAFLGTEDSILYSSCFDANGGLFETLTGPEDLIISDELNHASIIDGIRLSKAARKRYKNNDMEDLEDTLKETGNARIKIIVTDGVFSMDGTVANLKTICDLAERYDAVVAVDDSHATGIIGKTGRGSHEYCNVMGRVDIITGTFGKALGGASGGFTSGRRDIVALLRQRSRPYLFSNSLAPMITATTSHIIALLSENNAYKQKLDENTVYFRKRLKETGLPIIDGVHPIVPVMLGDELLTRRFAARVREKGVYAVGFVYPVVPKGKARIRTQVSAAHTREQLKFTANVFGEVYRELL